MTTKTDYRVICELMINFKPQIRSIINADEIKYLTAEMELDTRSEIELQNIRNTAVMLYSQKADNEESPEKKLFWMDCMSAVTHVIDSKLYQM